MLLGHGIGYPGAWRDWGSGSAASTCLVPVSFQELLTLRVMRQREEADTGRANARAKDGDTAGITTEEGDILAHPAEGLDLVEEPIVALGSLIASAQETWIQQRARGQ